MPLFGVGIVAALAGLVVWLQKYEKGQGGLPMGVGPPEPLVSAPGGAVYLAKDGRLYWLVPNPAPGALRRVMLVADAIAGPGGSVAQGMLRPLFLRGEASRDPREVGQLARAMVTTAAAGPKPEPNANLAGMALLAKLKTMVPPAQLAGFLTPPAPVPVHAGWWHR